MAVFPKRNGLVDILVGPGKYEEYNLAARWLLRQSGLVTARGEEFTPDELEHQPEVVGKDPATGEDVVLTPADPLPRIKILMKALE